MRKRTWKEYNQNLVNRGSLTFFIDKEALKPFCQKKKSRGRPKSFADPLIQLLLILKIQYRLTYRSLEGFGKSILPLLKSGVLLPTYSLICKRASNMEALLPKLSSRRPSVILIDSSGIKVHGEGEWKVKMHGKSKRRKWIKIHIAVDAISQQIIDLEVTESSVADCTAGAKIIAKCPKSATSYLAEGAYDTKQCREAIAKKGARALIPPRKNGRKLPGMEERNRAISERKGLGSDQVGLSLWGKLTGYSKRALVGVVEKFENK